jgi:UDP-N-acetylglucosamine--N-acetylmuramyl-(pentapeptide) pyrophosphoryl-undecaprenol N-acetylglucosamine transferase
LSLAHELKSQSPDCQIVYVGHRGDKFDSLEKNSHDFDFMAFIKAGKFRRYQSAGPLKGVLHPKTLALNVRDLFRLPSSVVTSYRLLSKFEPDVVFSKGGFVALPVGIAAHLKRIPIVTHDSDALPGLANRIIGRWASVHATGMPAEFYKYPRSSVEYVGIPINERIKKVTPKIQADYKKQLKLPEESQVLLLSGGGNGSQRLNNLLISIAPQLLETNLSVQIIHISGIQHEQAVKQAYRQVLPKTEQKRVRVAGFSSDFFAFSAAANLIITRAGATTLAELAVAGKACIIIPAPHLTGGHQLKNAEQLEKMDAAVIISQDVEPDELLVIVAELLNNDTRRWELSRNLFATAQPKATAKLADIILKTAKTKNNEKTES